MRLSFLDHLRHFEAAARCLSFKGAAEELLVTPAAVSQRIRRLETELGVDLFERRVRHVSLTTDGLLLASEVSRAFALIERAEEQIRWDREDRAVTITTTPTFAEQLLLPVLGKLHERIADRVVRVVVSNDLVGPGSNGVDFAIRQGMGAYPGFKARRILRCTYSPVCAPQLAAGRSIAPLIHVDWPDRIPDPPTWARWDQEKGRLSLRTRGVVHVPSEAMAIRSAISGHGHALVATELITEELQTGGLVFPLGAENVLITGHDYHLVEPITRLRKPAKEVRDWLVRHFG